MQEEKPYRMVRFIFNKIMQTTGVPWGIGNYKYTHIQQIIIITNIYSNI